MQDDSDNRPVDQYKWNNGNHTVNETNTYPLNNDPSNLSTLDFELDTYGTLTIEAYTDDQGWPTPHRTSIRWAVKPPHSIRGSRNARIAHGRAYENGQRQLSYLIVVDVAVVAPTTAADVRLTIENLMLYEDEESGDTHMAMYITINILTQRMSNTSWHSPLSALTSCLNMLGGDMMSPVGRAEKAAEAEGSAPIDRKVSAPW